MKKEKYIFLGILFLSIIFFLYNTFINFSNGDLYEFIDLWLISFVYMILNFLFFLLNKKNINLSIFIIQIVMFLKYSFTIFLYYYENTNVDIYNKNLTVYLMCIEVFMIYFVLFLFSSKLKEKKVNDKLEKQKFLNYKFIGVTAVICMAITILILIKEPNLLFRFFLINSNIESELSGIEYLIYKVTVILTTLFIIRSICMKINEKYNKAKIIFSLIIILYFSLNLSSSFDGNISRWTLLINIIIFINILVFYYPLQKKFLIRTFIIVIIILLPITTFLKFDKDDELSFSFKNVLTYTTEIINFRVMDSYFSGPYQVSIAIKTYDKFKNDINMETIFNDTFNNFPFFNNFLDKTNTTPYYYNYTYYGTSGISDKICPMIGQCYIHLGIIFAPIYSMIFIFIAIYAGTKLRNCKNEIKFYMLSYIAIFFSLSLALNFTIMFQCIWLEILPLYLVYKTNLKILKNKEKKCE